jgi:hypothetical protein
MKKVNQTRLIFPTWFVRQSIHEIKHRDFTEGDESQPANHNNQYSSSCCSRHNPVTHFLRSFAILDICIAQGGLKQVLAIALCRNFSHPVADAIQG